MAEPTLEPRVQELERRMTAVEQILPTLATKADLEAAIQTAVAPLATKVELQAVKADLEATLATKAELKAEAERTRRHFDAVAERMHDGVRLVAEGVAALQAQSDARHADVMRILTQHDRRLTTLEASASTER